MGIVKRVNSVSSNTKEQKEQEAQRQWAPGGVRPERRREGEARVSIRASDAAEGGSKGTRVAGPGLAQPGACRRRKWE